MVGRDDVSEVVDISASVDAAGAAMRNAATLISQAALQPVVVQAVQCGC
jgi:hypothetical protein